MRGLSRTSQIFRVLLFGAFVFLACTVPASQIVTNWAAFNDHGPGPLPLPNAWGTAPLVTGYDMRLGPGGNLTNFLNGQQLSVTMSVTPNGTPDNFPTMVTPYGGTAVSNLFFGIVDISNTNSGIGVRYSANTYVTLTFSGLTPSKHYIFRGSAVRGGSYPLRWSVHTIIGADTFVDAHIPGTGGPGILTSNNYPAYLEPGQVAINSGDNREGAVVGWDFISPGADGSFSIQSSNYVGNTPAGMALNNSYGYAICGMLLAEVEVAPPTITANPAPNTTVEENRQFSLSVSASGTPLLYQWYKEGVGPIANATQPTFTLPMAQLTDSGDYYVVVYNPLAQATSALAHVTVEADVTPPSIAAAYCYPTFDPATQAVLIDQVIIEYNELVYTGDGGATDSANYLLSDGNAPASVILTNDRTVVLKLSTPLAEDTEYTITVNGVKDLVSNPIENGTNNPASFRTWMRGSGNGLLYEAFNTGADVAVTTLLNSPNFPDHPFFRTNLWAFDSRVAFPDNTHEAYGSRTRGVFIPPVSGDWLFYLRTYDRADVYLNPHGLDASGMQLLVAETTGNDPHDYQKLISSPMSLRGGHAYYIEGLQQANAGTDYIKVVARLAGTGMPPLGIADTEIDVNTILGAAIGFPLAPRDLGGALTLVQDVEDVTAEEYHAAAFSVAVSNPSGLPMFYQWSLNGVDVPGANGPSYTIPRVSMLDDGSKVRVRVVKVGNALESREALLTVVADVALPTVEAIHGTFQLNQVRVSFSEAMLSDPGAVIPDPVNFKIDDGSAFVVQSAVVEPNGTDILLTLDTPLTAGGAYTITVDGIQDLAGNGNATITLPLQAFMLSQGFLRFDYFGGLSTTDNSLTSTLLADPRYPNTPDQRFFMSAFDSRTVFPTDSHEGYGARVIGWFTPPVSGNYIFYLRSDDSSRLYLNPTGSDPAGAVLIVEELSCCQAFSALPSTPQTLTAGQSYYVEALLKEGTSSDYVQVAAKLDTDPTDPDTLSPIPAVRLSTLADPVGASITITQQPVGALVTSVPSTNVLAVGASSTVLGQPNVNLSYVWQKNSGAGFEDILGAYGSTLTVVTGPSDNGGVYRCLVFCPGASATSAAAEIVVPRLAIVQDGTKVTVAWPATMGTAGFVLQKAGVIAAASWDTVPSGEYQSSAGMLFIEVTLPPGEPNQFYRLYKE